MRGRAEARPKPFALYFRQGWPRRRPRMPLTEQQRRKLLAYIEQKDRETEPVYVGREDLFELVAGNARAAARGNAAGRTVCIAGPPGVGKTAFLTELARRAEKMDPPMACVSVDPDCLGAPHLVMDAISKQPPDDWGPDAIGKVGKAAGRIRSLSILGVGASWEGDGDPGEGASTMPWGALDQAMKGSPPKSVICLAVDEAQKLSDTPGSDHNVLLRSLHMGPPPNYAGPPVFAVLAGLLDTPDVLGRSVSRLAGGNMQYMQCLDDDESPRYVQGTLDHFEVQGVDPGRAALTKWIAGECGGFPHHLRGAMESVADGLLKADSLTLSDLDGALVRTALRERRERYYRKRIEGAAGHVKRKLGELLLEWGKGPRPRDRHEGEAALMDFMDNELDEGTLRLMRHRGVGHSADLIDQMVRNGLLMTDAEGGGCRCPIDSLAAWMEKGEHAFRRPFPELAGPGRRNAGGSPSP